MPRFSLEVVMNKQFFTYTIYRPSLGGFPKLAIGITFHPTPGLSRDDLDRLIEALQRVQLEARS